MAVYRRAYRPYDGPLTPERSRFLAVSRYALAELAESKVLMGFVVLCMFPFLIQAAAIYVASSGAARVLLRIPGQAGPLSAEFFGMALTIQGGLAVFLSAWVAPVLVSPDLVNGALPLYLSRPLSRAEYVLGKAAALATLLSLVTWVPVITLFVLQAGLAPAAWALANLRMAWAILAGAWIWITVLTLLGLALSAWIRWRLVASASLFAVFFMGSAFGEVWSEVLATPWGRVANLGYMMAVVLVELFGTLPSQATSRELRELAQLPAWAALAGLGSVCTVSVWMLDRRLRAREVVS